MTVQVGIIGATITGDVGGTGISRQKFIRSDHGAILSADAGAAAAAWRSLWFACHSEVPIACTISWPDACEIIDDNTAAPELVIGLSAVPSPVNGGSTSHYAAGNGARINWATSNVLNRRLIRGATFLAPLTVDAFSAAGVLNSVQQTSYGTAAAAYLTAMAAANLVPVIHHRPKKGTFVGGVAAGITSFTIPARGSMLKSRRT